MIRVRRCTIAKLAAFGVFAPQLFSIRRLLRNAALLRKTSSWMRRLLTR